MPQAKTVTTRTVAPRTVTQNSIQWGNIIKGVAIVAAVAVAAVVTYGAVAAPVAQFVASNSMLSGLLSGLQAGVVYVANVVGAALSFVAGGIWNIISGILPQSITSAGTLGSLTGGGAQVVAAGAQAANVGTSIAGPAAGVAVAGGGLLVGLPIVGKMFSTMPLIAPETHTIAGHTEQSVTPAAALESHDIAGQHSSEMAAKSLETSSHAIEHSRQSGRPAQAWTERVPSNVPRREIAPREASHTAQISEERATPALAEAAR